MDGSISTDNGKDVMVVVMAAPLLVRLPPQLRKQCTNALFVTAFHFLPVHVHVYSHVVEKLLVQVTGRKLMITYIRNIDT